jgi:hypothetical protein
LSDPEAALRARLTALHDQLGRPTPKPLEGQQEIPLNAPDDTPQRATQQPLW